jgi:hypothetical protein
MNSAKLFNKSKLNTESAIKIIKNIQIIRNSNIHLPKMLIVFLGEVPGVQPYSRDSIDWSVALEFTGSVWHRSPEMEEKVITGLF